MNIDQAQDVVHAIYDGIRKAEFDICKHEYKEVKASDISIYINIRLYERIMSVIGAHCGQWPHSLSDFYRSNCDGITMQGFKAYIVTDEKQPDYAVVRSDFKP